MSRGGLSRFGREGRFKKVCWSNLAASSEPQRLKAHGSTLLLARLKPCPFLKAGFIRPFLGGSGESRFPFGNDEQERQKQLRKQIPFGNDN